ncbi:hypothetical protein Taro_021336 [Colocasia esculenta]|uniref:Uncharacterized protein n=1 Tax=Colocasia esculenta TaxID=4460 RepID=A0A843VB66_COLES|nr:hypothetical protein [Colocasia esculenta]
MRSATTIKSQHMNNQVYSKGIKRLGEALLGLSQEVPNQPPRWPSSGFLSKLQCNPRSGMPSSMIQQAPRCSRWPDQASKLQISGCKGEGFSQSENRVSLLSLLPLLQRGKEKA